MAFSRRAAPGGLVPSWARHDTVEVDLTRPFRLTSDPAKAFKSPDPGTGRPLVDKPTPAPFKAGGGVATKGQAWTVPVDGTKKLDPTTTEGNPLSKSTGPATGAGTAEGESGGLGGLGTGGEGEVDWIYLTEKPHLLNQDELLRLTRRYYPKAELLAGREGRVVAEVSINREGGVSRAVIVQSGGDLFDEAAQKVIPLARFTPARQGERAVAVKINWPIIFRPED